MRVDVIICCWSGKLYLYGHIGIDLWKRFLYRRIRDLVTTYRLTFVLDKQFVCGVAFCYNSESGCDLGDLMAVYL